MSQRESGLKVASVSCPLWPKNLRTIVRVSRSRMCTLKSSNARAIMELSWCVRRKETDSSKVTVVRTLFP